MKFLMYNRGIFLKLASDARLFSPVNKDLSIVAFFVFLRCKVPSVGRSQVSRRVLSVIGSFFTTIIYERDVSSRIMRLK